MSTPTSVTDTSAQPGQTPPDDVERERPHSPLKLNLVRLAVLVGTLGLWEGLSLWRDAAFRVSRPTLIWDQLWDWIRGIGIPMKVTFAAVIVFFFVFWNTYAGVRERNAELIDVLRVMGARRWHIIKKVVLPGAMSYISIGFKIAIPYALIGAIVGEIIASNRGLGFILMSSAGAFNTAGVFAALFVLMIVATILNAILNRSEGYVLRWKRAG